MAKRPVSKRLSITISLRAYQKLENMVQRERLKSVSLAVSRIIDEALDKYPDQEQANLPL